MSTQLIIGWHAVKAALQDTHAQGDLYLLKGRRDNRSRQIQQQAPSGVQIHYVDNAQLDAKATGQNHQGCVLEAAALKQALHTESDLMDLVEDVSNNPVILALDGVTDPHNLGACLRSADAAGVAAVIVPKDNAAGLNATVRKVAAGAAESVPLIPVTNLARTLGQLQSQGLWITGLAGEADQVLYEMDFKGPTVIVMGAEGSGMRKNVKLACDYLAKLPMSGQVESLNVSVATGITLFEVVRQRL